MESLPSEIIGHIAAYLTLEELWRLRGLSKQWRMRSERLFVDAFQHSAVAPFQLLLSVHSNALEGNQAVRAVDMLFRDSDYATGVFEFGPRQEKCTVDIPEEIDLDKTQFSLKGLLVWRMSDPDLATASKQSSSITSPRVLPAGEPFRIFKSDQSVVLARFENGAAQNKGNILSFDMDLAYSAEFLPEQRRISLTVHHLRASLSHLFRCIAPHPEKQHLIERVTRSIFPAKKIARVQAAATDAGLVWRNDYYGYDVVLSWLNDEESSDADLADIMQKLAMVEALIDNAHLRAGSLRTGAIKRTCPPVS